MTTVYVVSNFNFDRVFDEFLQRILGAFKHRCVVIDNSEYKKLSVAQTDDIVIDFFNGDVQTLQSVDIENRYTFICDEGALNDGTAYAKRIKSFQQNGCKKAIVTYANKQHLKCLENAGISYVYMPLVMPEHREITDKSISVIGTGNFESTTYPARHYLAGLLQQIPDSQIRQGYPCLHEDYYKLLDKAEIGIVCCAGHRDRLLSKYCEFGACNVLPIGDCPTYMPAEMKQAMLNVTNFSDKKILDEVNRLLVDKTELKQRQESYSQLCRKYFDSEKLGNQVYDALVQ